MKKILLPISAIFSMGMLHAQSLNLSSTENYVYSKTYLTEQGSTNVKSVETVQYFDGLGRPKQVVNIKASPTSKDVVTHIVYDEFGRQKFDYLPVPQSGTGNGAIVANPLSNATQTDIYGAEKIYAEKVFENSPLDRILEQKQPGNAWNSKPVKFEYDANNATEVKKYTATFDYSGFSSQITLSATPYPANQLYKNTVTDEDGNKTIEFKNGQGQTVLVRKVISATENADTYYVYNDYNQLAYVIPPLAVLTNDVSTTTLENLCYQYKYDARNRLVEKRLPGKGWEFMVYDKQDRLIATQDANLAAQGQWLFTKYDQFGRVAITGISTGGARTTEQNNADNFGSNNVVRVGGSSFTREGMDIHYRAFTAYPADADYVKILSVNYYDTYAPNSFSPAFPTTVQNVPVAGDNSTGDNVSTKSLPVMSFVKNIEDDNWTKNYTWYDKRGKAIASHSINHLGGYTKTESLLDLSGTPQLVITKHKRLDSDMERTITENFTYDNQNRLKVQTHQVDSNPVEYLAQIDYNELSQIKNKKIGGISTQSPLQTVDFTYNIRGWMTGINNPMNLGLDFFGFNIKYTDPVNTNAGSGRYNGNIAEVDWNTSMVNDPRRYTYTYDGLNRLKDAVYTEPAQINPEKFYYNEHLTYDRNGNIKTLKRFAYPETGNTIAQKVDDLDYNYTGNRVTQITDTGNSAGYEGGGGTIQYDVNGNMIKMPDKGINGITYNHLNLPSVFSIYQNYNTVTGNYSLAYLYRADGVKLRKRYQSVPGRGGNSTTKVSDYLDGFHYNSTEAIALPCLGCPIEVAYEISAYRTKPPLGESLLYNLDFVGTAEGFYSYTENRYIYQYKDHLGNARVSYAKKGDGTVEITDTNDYYPFGLNHIGSTYKGYLGSYYNYKLQEQEIQETGFYTFKWRQYMPDVGRFFNIDPLSEKYVYNSTYAFAENRVIDCRELEGLEWSKSTLLNQDGTKTHTINAHIKLLNNSKNFTSQNMKDFQTSYINNMKNSYNGITTSGDKLGVGKITFENVNSVKDGDYSISIVDQVLDPQGNAVSPSSDDTTVKGMIQLEGEFADPINGYIGNSQQNNMQVVPSGKNGTGEKAAHETGHTFGLRHNTDNSNPLKNLVLIWNLMYAPQMGNGIIPEQRDIVIKNIPDEKKTNP